MIRLLWLPIVALFLVGCPAFNAYVTPDPNSKAYHCKDENGQLSALYQWCMPFDGSRDCCWPGTECASSSSGPWCSPLPTPGMLGASRVPSEHLKRRAESP